MSPLEDALARIASKTEEQRSSLPIALDLVGAYEAAELLRIGRAALWARRRSHENFLQPVAELRCGPVWFRWQIQDYQAQEQRLGRRGWYGSRPHSWRYG